MDKLNGLSLARAMQRCNRNLGYQVIILFKSAARRHDFIDEMLEYDINDNESDIKGISRHMGLIKFKNGSYIRAIGMSTNARGLQANEILYDDGVTVEDALKLHIRQSIYHCRNDDELWSDDEVRADDTSESLDEFLDGFRITANSK